MPKKAGFTLIELLVVITIIAVLAAIGLLSYSKFIQTSRDAKRQSDLKVIQSALEQYHADQKFYPDESFNPSSGGKFTNCTGNVSNPACTVSKVYLNNVPQDPYSSTPYCYRSVVNSTDRVNDNCASGFYNSSSTRCQHYFVCAKLENSSGSVNCTCSGYNYQVTPP